MTSHPSETAPNHSQITRVICETTPDLRLCDQTLASIPQHQQPAATRTHAMIASLAGMADPGMCPEPALICGTSPKQPSSCFADGRL